MEDSCPKEDVLGDGVQELVAEGQLKQKDGEHEDELRRVAELAV